MPGLYQNRKLHYRMYKAGKRWVFAGVAVITFATGMTLTTVANADSDNTTSTLQTTAVTSTASKSAQASNGDTSDATTTAGQNSAVSSSASSTTQSQSTASSDSTSVTSNKANSESSASESGQQTDSPSSTNNSDQSQTSAASTNNSESTVSSAVSITQKRVSNTASQSATSAQTTESTSASTAQSTGSLSSTESSSNVASVHDAVSTTNKSQTTSSTTNSNVTVTSISDTATDSDVATAESAATSAYQATGTPQEIVRMDATGFVNGYQEGVGDSIQYNGWTILYKQGTTFGGFGLIPNTYVSPVYYLSGSYSESTTPSDGVLGVTKHFTIFTFDSLTAQNIGSTYRIAAGGNLTLSGSSGSSASQYTDYPQIIVGGDLVELDNANPTGKIYINNDASVYSNYWSNTHQIYKIDTTDFFTAAKAYLASKSNELSALQQTAGAKVITPSSSNPNLTLQGVDGADEDVFVLNSSDFPGTTYGSGAINITNVTNSSGGTAKIIINVVGDSVAIAGTTISVNGKTDADTAANVTWNMPDVVSLVTHNAALTGNILAPNATFYTDGSISTSGNIAVKTFGEAALNSFTTKYVDENGNQIHQSMSWAVNNTTDGSTKTVSPVAIDGYEVTGTPTVSISSQDVVNNDGSVTVTYDQSSWATNTVTFHYKKVSTPVKAAASLTVNYVDEDDSSKTLADSKTLSGLQDDTYNVSDYEPAIPGYTLDVDDASLLSGKLTSDGQTVTLRYKANSQSVTVSYVDQNGHPIHTTDTVTGKTNTSYDATNKEISIPGYSFVKVQQGDLKGTFSVDNAGKSTAKDIVLQYQGGSQTLAVHYLDNNGKTIHTDNTVTGAAGDSYDVSDDQLTIPGYTFSAVTTGSLTGTYTVDTTGKATTPAVTLMYTVNPQSVTIHYVDENGKSLASDGSLTGATGTAYDAQNKILSLDGYTFDKVTSGSLTGTYDANGTPAITLVYDKVVPKSGSVVVRYINGKTNTELASAQTLTGTVGDTYTTASKTFDGYTLEGSSSATGSYTDAGQTVTFTYLPKSETKIVNYYLVNTANALAPSTTLTGDYGTSQTADAASIAGYTALSNSQVVNFTDDTSAINFYYQPEDAAAITVKDVLTDGTVISTRTLPAGKYGQAYSTSADALTGYVWNQTTPSNATGTYSLTPQTVTYTYDREDGQPVTVNYVVNGTTKVLGTTQLTGHYGDSVTAQTATFSNYTLVGTPAQTTTTLTDRPQTMTFLYDDTGDRYVNVSYVRRVTVGDEQELLTMAAPTVTTVDYDSQYTTAPVNITGYYVSASSVAGPANGSWSDLSTDAAKNQVVYYYNADPESFKVTYTDLQGNDLFSQTPAGTVQLVNAYYGVGYNFTAPAIVGYTLVSDATVSGTVGLNPSDIHFTYAKEQAVTTHYVDDNGNVIATPVSQTLNYGGTYTTQPATVSGYTLVATPANASGQYDRTNTANSVDVIYVYQKVAASETPTSGPSTSMSPSQAPSTASTPASGASTVTSVVTSQTTSQTSTPESGMSVTPSQVSTASMPSIPNQGTETVPPRVVPVNPVSASPVIPVVTPTGNRPTNETPANEAGTPIVRQMMGDPTLLQSNAVPVTSGSQSTRTIVDEPSWDPIRLVLMDVDGDIIAVHEVSGYTGTWVYIGDLVPAGYHLAPGQSAWLLLNDVSPQTLRLVKDSDGTMVAATSASTLSKNQTPSTAQSVTGSDTQTAATATTSRAAANSATNQNLLPHTNEGQQSWLQALGLGLFSMLFGLFGWRKRRHNTDDNKDSDI
ncbi:hypothetical protein LROSL1_0566 [Furfurilactobacillus rossiae]|uniref:MucBP domain-containing protein n=1 Tax=Furfurilactobacillus rossiae TaxID=231049 RepID=UPI0015C131BC|nr:MucBP domain-containing protein [Furfurilactobacillus rossiae]MCF6165572.1 MucBP domain-containing protein [Furfurilactobacillus rossiae]QLE63386.1 hypothetical protein LROSL1_0566 [Furfurilactobacillus rossiae]